MPEIFVYANWNELMEPVFMGSLLAESIKGKEVFSFSYDPNWLASGNAQHLDPELKLFTGPQYSTDEKPNFGIFLDSSPDRWGRTLMKRREAISAREEKITARTLLESDYLLGVNDSTRMGALRFKLAQQGPFLNNNEQFCTPPISSIRELEQASLRYEEDDFIDDPKAKHWLGLLVAPGSSLGGARPKANVIDPDGNLYLAKFPSKSDIKDAGAWEYVAHQLGLEFGLTMADAQANIFSQKRHTFLSKRFDRKGSARIHFASAMTLLGYKDGQDAGDGVSYLELVELLEQYGADPTVDIRVLWKRIVFSVAISNTDDHLRNHGFILVPNSGWKLSPAYDINPEPDGMGLSLNINENDNSLSFDLCMEVHQYFRWNKEEAEEEIKKVKALRDSWQEKSKTLGIKRNEQEEMRSAFERG